MPAKLVKEAVDNLQLTRTDDLVVDILSNCQIEHAETERREHDRTIGRQPARIRHHVGQRAVQELSVARLLLGQVGRGVGFQAVFDVIDHVGRGQDYLWREVPQRHVEHQRIVGERRQIADVWLTGDSGEDDQIARSNLLVSVVVHGYRALAARLFQVLPESVRTLS